MIRQNVIKQLHKNTCISSAYAELLEYSLDNGIDLDDGEVSSHVQNLKHLISNNFELIDRIEEEGE